MNVSFPLRDGYFRPLQHTPQDEARWRHFVEELVERSLIEERPYAASQYSHVDSTKWKPLREKDQLRVYRPRSCSSERRHRVGNPQVVLAVGTIEGTLEDVIHGIHHVTTKDMRVTTSFLSDDALDSAVIHVFDNGVEGDVYRSFAVKWRIIETPAGGLVKNRDGVVLEYMGIDVDASGHKYAFHISETFDHPVCPPFSAQCAIRAKAHIRTIYRQVSPGRVGVYFYGDYSLNGKIPGILARLSTAEIAISVGKSVECTEAKKLTALALTSSPVLHKQRRRRESNRDDMTECSICHATPGLLTTRTLALCHLCGLCVCSKCRSRKYLLSDESKIAVTCCKQCIVAARNLTLDPRLPLRLITASVWRSQNVITGDDHGWERDAQSVEHAMISNRSQDDDASSNPSSLESVRSRKVAGFKSARTNSVESDRVTVGTATTSVSSGGSSSVDLLSSEEINLLSTGSIDWRSPSLNPQPQPQPQLHCEEDNVEAQLWERMTQLRVAAEETYQLTQHNNALMVGDT